MDADTPGTEGASVWFLNAEELAATRVKIAKLQQRAHRKGFTGAIDVAAVPATRSSTSAGGLPVTVHGFDVTITGEPPRYKGWRFVAAVDAVDGGTVLRYPPGAPAEVPNDQIRAGECDHCHTTRARRSTVLVAPEDTGQLLQVGRSCLKDFLGHSTLPVFLTTDDVSASLGGSLSGTPAAWDVHSVLTYAAAAVEAFGWTPVSASEHGRVPTRDLVRLALTGGRGADQLRDQLAPPSRGRPSARPAASRRPARRPDRNLGLRGEPGRRAARGRGRGQASGVGGQRDPRPPAADRGPGAGCVPAGGRSERRPRRHRRGEGHYVRRRPHGHAGGRVYLPLTRQRAAGRRLRVAVAKMTTAAAWAYGVHVGDPLTVTGTVKAHTEWNGIKQTVLTRPKKHDPAPVQESMPDAAPRLWETVTSPRLDGAAAARHTTVRTPARGVHLAR